MTNPALCEIIVLLDRSGSMQSIRNDMEGGFNAFILEQRQAPGACNVTLVQFDSDGIDDVYTAMSVDRVPPLALHPRGGTPLLDAMGTTIVKAGERLKAIDDAQRPGRVLFLVITDGQENASREYTKARIKAMVEEQTNAYQWAFSFLGANIDSFSEAGSVGVLAQGVANYTPDAAGVAAAFSSVSSASVRYRGGQSYGFTDEERDRMNNTPSTP